MSLLFEPPSTWEYIKRKINQRPVGKHVYRQFLIKHIKAKPATIDSYVYTLILIGFLVKVSPGKYQVMQHIPKKMSLTKARELAYDKSWKKWFIPLEERLKMLDKRKKKK